MNTQSVVGNLNQEVYLHENMSHSNQVAGTLIDYTPMTTLEAKSIQLH